MTLPLSELLSILPLLIIAAAAVAILLVVSFHRNQTLSAMLTLGSLLLAGISLPIARSESPQQVSPLLRIDDFAIFFMGLLLAAALVVTLLAHSYLKKYRMERSELYILLLLSELGALTLTASNHFISFFLGLELLSVPLYVMIGYVFSKEQALEATTKYLFLAATSSAFLLFGMALVYAELGTMEFPALSRFPQPADSHSAYLLAGSLLIFTGAGFKLSLVPFHMWTPDVYQGAPAPVTAYLASVSKGCVVAVLLRFVTAVDFNLHPGLVWMLTVVAATSMLAGNCLALLQNNIKRILAYSSITHLGYILVAFLVGGANGASAATFYLVAYFAATLAAFGAVGQLSPGDREADSLNDYRGLYSQRPGTAAVPSLAVFSLIGLPLTAGFMGKFALIRAGAESGLWGLLILLVASSAIGIFPYLRIIISMYSSPQDSTTAARRPSPSWSVGAVLGGLTLLTLAIGLYPEPLLQLIQTVVHSLVETQ